jgi:hypothetical protein
MQHQYPKLIAALRQPFLAPDFLAQRIAPLVMAVSV